ncbi:hypothetical protein G4B88_005827 [Cannabis sativa]|uniref:Uncharacterized protein n=1 Tax=Cannabis sativa TaxID=3483 RepID=A0A7J6G5J3_CANSA|nr:hypothetical protein G4B88_005827 [Cannabis sativa]
MGPKTMHLSVSSRSSLKSIDSALKIGPACQVPRLSLMNLEPEILKTRISSTRGGSYKWPLEAFTPFLAKSLSDSFKFSDRDGLATPRYHSWPPIEPRHWVTLAWCVIDANSSGLFSIFIMYNLFDTKS